MIKNSFEPIIPSIQYSNIPIGAQPLSPEESYIGVMTFPFVISLPHCSERIPGPLRPDIALSEEKIRESTDIGTREIFGGIPAVAVVSATWSRLVVDLNRDRNDRGPKGVIQRLDYFGRPVYLAGSYPDDGEVAHRLTTYYRPYHDRLREGLKNPRAKVLFDCHSMNGIGPPEAPDSGRKRADIALGNNGDIKGGIRPSMGLLTCPEGLLKEIKRAFQGAGFSVSLNDPYAGGFITTHYGKQMISEGKAAVQIEINQDLFMASGTTRPAPNHLRETKGRVFQAMKEITSIISLKDINI